MKTLLPALIAAAALGACTAAPPPSTSGAQGTRDAVNAACRAQAERVVNYRDRGQTMRQDDYNARVGTSSYLGPQVITDQIAQVYDRDRMAADCVRSSGDPRAPRVTTTGGGLSGR